MCKITCREELDNGKRYRVRFNDEKFIEINAEDYFRLYLYEKESLTKEEYDHITEKIIFSQAKKKAIDYISFKKRTTGEVRKKLEESGFQGDIIDHTILYYEKEEYLDDEKYCEKFIAEKRKLKPCSKKEMVYMLSQKGVNDAIIQKAIENAGIDETEVIKSIYNKKFKNADLNNYKDTVKIMRYFANKRFEPESIENLILYLKEGIT